MKSIIAAVLLLTSCGAAHADELNDMPDLACARASSDLEREQIGCRTANVTQVGNPGGLSPLDRSEEN